MKKTFSASILGIGKVLKGGIAIKSFWISVASISVFVVVVLTALLNLTFYIDDSGLHYVLVKDIDVFKSEGSIEFDSIEIISPGANLTIKKGETLAYEFSAASSINTKHSIENGKLKIEQELKGKVFGLQIANNDDHITVYVPEKKTLKEIEASCKIGRYLFEGLQVDSLSHEVLHGDTDLLYSKIGELNIDIKSGDLLIEQTPAEKAAINMVSGSLRATNFDTKELDFDFITGDFRLEGKREGKTRLECFAADMDILIYKKDELFDYDIQAKDGEIIFDEQPQGTYKKIDNKSENKFYVRNEKGDINIKFEESY